MSMLSDSIAANLRELISERCLTQAQVAAVLGLSQQAVSDRLTGKVRLSLDDVVELSDLLAVPVGELLSPREVSA